MPTKTETNEATAEASTWQNFARRLRLFLSLAWSLSPTTMAAQLGLELLQSVDTVAQLYVAKRILDSIVAAARDPAHPVGAVRYWVLVEFGLFVAGLLLNTLGRLWLTRLTQQAELKMRVRLMTHCAAIRYARFEEPDFLTRLQLARQANVMGVVVQLFSSLRQIATLTGSIAILSTRGLGVLAVILAAAIPSFVFELRMGRRSLEHQKQQIDRGRRAAYYENLLLSEQSVREVKALGLAGWLLEQFANMSRSVQDELLTLAQSRQNRGTVMHVYVQVVYVVAYLEAAMRAALGLMTVGDMTVSIAVFKSSQGGVGMLFTNVTTFYRSVLAMEPLFEFFEEPTEDSEVAGDGDPLPPSPQGCVIELRDVSFQYPNSDRAVISNVSLTIRAGETVALVGRNGSGKTTLVKLLLGLYRPTSGKIFLDGVDTSRVPVRKLRERVSVVFQDFARLQMTAADNVGVGWLPDRENDAALERAITSAGAVDVVSQLSGGLSAQLGKLFRGIELSGGQWQRLALARAALRPSGLLVLDEPTAALDAEAEIEVFRRMIEVKSGRTTLLITHRFSTIHMADRIVVLDEGRVAEDGTHADLVQRGGRYAAMYLAQAQGFLDVGRSSVVDMGRDSSEKVR